MGKDKTSKFNKTKLNESKPYSQEFPPNETNNYQPSFLLNQKSQIYLKQFNNNSIQKTSNETQEISTNRNTNKNDLKSLEQVSENDNRKNSEEFDNCSTSNEEYTEKKIKKKTAKKNKKKQIKQPFKSNASDFKIKYKTELCKYFEINGYCKYGDNCAYAHGKENLRSKVTNTTAYRTRKCVQFFEVGYCPYGNRCQFAHQLESNILNNPYDRKMTYSKILETISKIENVENIKKLIEKPRLKVFQDICDGSKGEKPRLLDDIKALNNENLFERLEE